jgi:hypothetical protein
MTELLLNLLWLSVALGATAVWRLSWARERHGGQHATFREWTALACSLVLLFFAVSLSDDLHEEVILSDVCSASRKQVSGSAAGARVSSVPVERQSSTAILPQAHPLALLSTFARISFEANSAPVEKIGAPFAGRSPPASAH